MIHTVPGNKPAHVFETHYITIIIKTSDLNPDFFALQY